jgi:O-antigen ligase
MKALILTYLLTYGGALLALFEPLYGLYIYVAFAIISPETIWAWSVPQGGNYSRILAGAMLAGWAFRGFGSWNFGPTKGIVFGLLFFWLWSIVSATFAPNQQAARLFLEDISKIVLPVLVGLTIIDTTDKLIRLVWVIVLSATYLSWEITSYYLFSPAYSIEAIEQMAGTGRAVLGTGLLCTFTFALFLLLSSKSSYLKGLAFVCLILIGHSIFLTFSRGALFGLLVSLIIFFLLVPNKNRYLWALPFVIFLGYMMSGPQVWERFATIFASKHERDASAQSRIDLWRNCLDVIQQEPLLGVGPDHFLLISKRFGWDKPKEAHNLWLQMAAELGLPGALGLVLFYGLTGRGLIRLTRENFAGPWFQLAAVACVAAIAGFVASSCFVTVQRLEIPYYVALVGAGLIKVSGLTERTPTDEVADTHSSQEHNPEVG